MMHSDVLVARQWKLRCSFTCKKVHGWSSRGGRKQRHALPFPLSLIFLHSPSLFPPFLPLSSALAQDCINILLKPVSTAARSPSLPPSLLRWLFLFPPFLTVAFRFFSVSLFCWRDRFPHNFYQPVQKGEAVLLSSVRSSPCCTHAHSHTCVHTHTYWGGGYRCLWQSMLIGSEWLLPLVGEWNGYF